MPTNCNYLARIVSHSISFRDEDGVPKFNEKLLHPCTNMYAETLSVLQVLGKIKQSVKFQHRSSMHHASM